jgi:hypothetical protein
MSQHPLGSHATRPQPLEPRLQQRHQHLVQEHLRVSQRVAAGLKALPGTATSFASTQAAWRFYHNERVSLPALAQPLIEQGRAALTEVGAAYALVMHDWSHLNYDRHTRKADRFGSVQEHRQGYELQSALLVSDRDGAPLAPLYQNLRSTAGLHTTRAPVVLPAATHLDELRERWAHLATLGLGRPLVHIVDREGDSIGHYRQWQDHRFLVRAKGGQRVEWAGQSATLATVAAGLKSQLVFCREVQWHGQTARQYVGETAVVLTRRSRQKRRGQKPTSVAGEPVRLRLIVSEVRAEHGRVLAQWLLLSNVDPAVDATVLALWYYWRWRIESFFKLLKGAGQQVEQWQQRDAVAVARRLLVVSAALVLVWQLARAQTPAASELRTVLVRLSGRQMKHGCGWTAPALLDGVWVLLAMLDLLDHCELTRLRQLAATLFNPKAHEGSQHV